MKKAIYLIVALFCACNNPSVPADEHQASTTDSLKSQHPQPTIALETNKTYPFMELKNLYDMGWKGEEKGHPELDKQTVKVVGAVFGKSRVSGLVGDEIVEKGMKLQFRGSQFADPDFGHDLECMFALENINLLEAIKEGDTVSVQGIIDKQELYIEPKVKYTVLTLKDCELMN